MSDRRCRLIVAGAVTAVWALGACLETSAARETTAIRVEQPPRRRDRSTGQEKKPKRTRPKKPRTRTGPKLSPEQQLEVRLKAFSPAAMRRAIADMTGTFPGRYTRGEQRLRRLGELEKRLPETLAGVAKGDAAAVRAGEEILAFQAEALLANPLLDFEKLLLVRRRGDPTQSLPANWQGNCVLKRNGFDNEIAVLSPVRPEGKLTTVYQPDNGSFVGDVDLHWDAGKMLFSQVGGNGKWQVHEVGIDGGGLREVTRGQMAVYMARAMVAPTTSVLADYVPSDPCNFSDVTTDHWAYTYVEFCVEQGIVGGYPEGDYRPDVVATREQMAVYVARAFELPY